MPNELATFLYQQGGKEKRSKYWGNPSNTMM